MNSLESVIHWLFNFAVLTNTIMVYLNINKIWVHKHEVVVSESISVGARLIGIVVASTFLLHFLVNKDYGSSISYVFFLVSDIIFFLTGIGFWSTKRKKNRKKSNALQRFIRTFK